MNIVVWTVQSLLAAACLAHGLLFLFPPAAVAAQMDAMLPRWFQLFLGVAEIASALGITVPGVARVQPQLVPMAAAGMLVVLASATVLHVVRGEYSSAATTTVLLALAAFVAWQRTRVRPIAPRQAARS